MLLAHAAVTWFLVGLIWTVQVVHYPLFAEIGEDRRLGYQAQHMRRITWVVGPTMLAELGLAAALVLRPPPGADPVLAAWGLGLLLVIWLSTALLQGPAHGRLAARSSERDLVLLVRSNWIRTILWTVRGGLALALLHTEP